MQLQQSAPVKDTAHRKVIVWEAFDAADAMTQAAAKLYEQTLAADERIPWMWIEQSVQDRAKSKPRPGGWSRHLLLAAPEGRQDDPDALAGYVYGALLPGYGGYLCYVGVADWKARMGVGSRLYEQFFKVLRVDAGELGEPLPFVIWESHRPDPLADASDWENWTARTKLFDRVGGLWVDGVDFLSPNFAADEEDDERRRCHCSCSSNRWTRRKPSSRQSGCAKWSAGCTSASTTTLLAARCSTARYPSAANRVCDPRGPRVAARASAESWCK